MSTRLAITPIVQAMVQAVLFGVGLLVLLWTPLGDDAANYFPAMVIVSALICVPVAWKPAPLLGPPHQRRLAHRRMEP